MCICVNTIQHICFDEFSIGVLVLQHSRSRTLGFERMPWIKPSGTRYIKVRQVEPVVTLDTLQGNEA